MLCKAALMGDFHSYVAIREAPSPPDAKALGRNVKGFREDLWNAVVCSVAFEVVFQKFSKIQMLQPLLLATGEKVMCEATRNDRNWGIGIDRGDPRCQNPPEWRGTNILGWALMEVRSALRAGIYEKAFLKCCKVVRDIRKLEELNSKGEKLAANQEQKLQKKSAALKDVRDTLELLAGDSALRQNNDDVIKVALAELDVPKQVIAVVEGQLAVVDGDLPSMIPGATAGENTDGDTLECLARNSVLEEPNVPKQAHEQVDSPRVTPSAIAGEKADDQKLGKARRKRGGRSHGIRKYEADHVG